MITIRPRPNRPQQGILSQDGRSYPCALGRSGLTSAKREGDGATPLITTKPLYGFYRPDRETRPPSALPFHALKTDMGWCDDRTHPSYNQPVSLPFDTSHEALWREDALYDLIVVLDINITRRTRGAGSALFMHVARDGYRPTEGCIALAKRDLRQLLKALTPQTRIRIMR